MKQKIKRVVAFLFALAFALTGMQIMEAQAAAKPVISSGQITIKGSSCTIAKGRKVKLIAKSGKTNVTKKCAWKSSKKAVATVSSKGVLTAKKAGTAYITAKYKGKTSKRLKVAVRKESTTPSNSASASDPNTEPEQPSVQGAHTITYNVNSKNNLDKLSGSSKQYVSGEILKFNTTVSAGSGHKFLGWYDAPTGGKRIYETYKPTKNMTLYAHYTDKNVQKVTFSLGCNYGGTYSFMSGRSGLGNHYRDYDWLKQEDLSGPMEYGDPNNVAWKHNYIVNGGKNTFSVDDMPVPSVPGHTFVGWYTEDFLRAKGIGSVYLSPSAERIEKNSDVDTDTTVLYARFTKKLTVSFDDLRGGKYDDIVVDSYKSISDCGQKLPVPKIPGATFVGWTMDADNHSMNWSKAMITNDSVFLNCIEWFGFMCSGCLNVSKHRTDDIAYCEKGCTTVFNSVNDDYHVFEETDHFTLYPVYEYQNVILSFDPTGGYFPYDAKENRYLSLTFEDGIDDWDYSHKTVATLVTQRGSQPYGTDTFPGHESESSGDGYYGCWSYGNGYHYLPIIKRVNYVFDKWVYIDEKGEEQEFTFDTILTKNMTVYAKWALGKCSVSYNATDGKITTEERNRVGLGVSLGYTVTTGSTLAKDAKEMPVPVSAEGREFLGWYTSDSEAFAKDMVISEDVVLFAKWGPLPKDLPVTIEFYAGGGTFKDSGANSAGAGVKSKSISRSEVFGQFFELAERNDYEFLGWYVLYPDAAEPYTDASFMKKVTETTNIQNSMIDSNDTVRLYARWKQSEHVSDMDVSTFITDKGTTAVEKHNNHYSIEHKGKGDNTDLEFVSIALPKTVPDSLKNIRWTSSDPNIIYIDGSDTTKSGEWIDWFKFGGSLGDVTLTATSADNPNVSLDIHITVL